MPRPAMPRPAMLIALGVGLLATLIGITLLGRGSAMGMTIAFAAYALTLEGAGVAFGNIKRGDTSWRAWGLLFIPLCMATAFGAVAYELLFNAGS